jgi:hypothetical protein
MALKAEPGIASPHILSRGNTSLLIKATLNPLPWSASAQVLPDGPAPIIATSKSTAMKDYFYTR